MFHWHQIICCEDIVLRSEPFKRYLVNTIASPDRSDDGYVAQYIGVNTSFNKSSDGANERNSDINDGDDVGNLPSLPPATQTSEKIILTEEDIP